MSRVTSGSRTLPVPVLALAYLGFVSLGLPDGLLGVGWPSMRADFGAPVGAVGFVLGLFTAGYLASSVAAGFVQARLGVGRLLAASTGLVSLALTGWLLSPVLGLAVGAALVLGLGSGAVDAGLNTYAAGHFGARHMNWLHASFGLGATIGPLVMSTVLGADASWRWGYGTVALAQAVLGVAFWLTVRLWDDGPVRGCPADRADPSVTGPASPDRAVPPGRVPARHTLVLPSVWLGVVLFFVYTGAEAGTGLWAYTLLTEGRGVAAGLAGVCVSAYWGSLFAGRVLYGAAGHRLRTRPVLVTCMLVMGLGAGLLSVPGSVAPAVVGLVLVGGFAAPVFPLLTLTTEARVGPGHASRAIGMQIGGAGLGSAALPSLVGVLIGRYGAGVLGPAVLVLVAVMVTLYLALVRGAPRARSAEVGTGGEATWGR